MVTSVELSLVIKSFRKLPHYVVARLKEWVKSVEEKGIREVRKSTGYHDEPLRGKRRGQRSVRLTRAYRIIYSEYKDGCIEVVLVEEVNKHDY